MTRVRKVFRQQTLTARAGAETKPDVHCLLLLLVVVVVCVCVCVCVCPDDSECVHTNALMGVGVYGYVIANIRAQTR